MLKQATTHGFGLSALSAAPLLVTDYLDIFYTKM
jgi:hypothetical protein